MIRFLLIVLFSVFCYFDAEAIVVQSAEQALSYKNVARGTKGASVVKVNKPSHTYSAPVANTPEAEEPENKEIDLSEKASAEVSLSKGDTATVTVKEESGFVWKVKYDNSAVIFTNKGASKGTRTFLFKQYKDDKDSEVYFDYINKEDQSVVENKALFIKGK